MEQYLDFTEGQDTYGHWDPDPPLYLGEKEAEKTPLISEAKASLGESREVLGNIMELRRPPTPPYDQLIAIFFGCSFDLILKRHFSSNYWNPQFLLLLLLLSGSSFARGRPLILTTTKRA